jgi:hypothetical protein
MMRKIIRNNVKDKLVDEKNRNIDECHKKPILQIYYEAGYLGIINSKFSPEDRKRAGEMLAQDYYLGNYNSLQKSRFIPINIRTTGEWTREKSLFFKERYLRAIKTLPTEFWTIVRRVCVEDLPILSVETSGTMRKYDIYHQKILLNYGLDRLIYFYYKKNDFF